jgi:hypothetical protein
MTLQLEPVYLMTNTYLMQTVLSRTFLEQIHGLKDGKVQHQKNVVHLLLHMMEQLQRPTYIQELPLLSMEQALS